ncbi:TPR repeat-containing protein YpiA [Lentibacillus sp. JNUCC-1]|uniref:tetratricopeptide repeat protein n=1 Tax=Lentibacillus sp. JNUCC-1 TaxID=2654513 RepID=UPI0012E74771|nr:tetratricopeptide repeat protein [Lentibacillus sp. JNUCC-1]MUV39781.1 TPR repeat-containing protein YpiA [Lentibacillus sp. JNUCC-1]
MEEIMKAIRLMEQQKHDEAVIQLETALETADEEEMFTIAEIYQQWGYVKEAAEILEILRQSYPGESELNIMLADLYIEVENDEQAIELLNEVKTDDEAYVQSLVQLADLYQAQGLFEVAEQKLLEAKQLEPNEMIIDFALGELYFSIGDHLKSINYYERVLPESTVVADISVGLRLAEAHAASGGYEEAINYYRDAEPEDPDTLFKYGLAAHQIDRNDIAIHVWEQVIELDMYYHTAYYYLAEAYDKEEMTKEALNAAKKGLTVDEYNAQLYFLAGKLAHKLGEDDESEQYLRQSIALDPDYKEAILFLVEMFKSNDSHEAIIDLLQEVNRTETTDALYEWELARAYYENESFKDALKHYDLAYNTLKQDSDFLKEYAYFLIEEGRKEKAIQIFESYLLLQPLDTETEAYVDRLKETHTSE